MIFIVQVFYTLLPVVMAGICNMILVKLPVLGFLKTPMDNEAVCADGKRLFGANKTWKGFWGMVFFTGFWMWVFGTLDNTFSWAQGLSLIDYHHFSAVQELFYGFLWGLGYVLFELPNSYVKRRIDIPPGENRTGFTGHLFKFIDQADSVLGCMIFMLFFYIPTPLEAAALFVAGVIIHYLINILLFLVGLKNQAG